MTEQTSTSRSLTQEEINAYNRLDFQMDIFKEIRRGVEVKFLAIGKHYSAVYVKQVHDGEFEFGTGAQHFYTYMVSDVMRFLEKIYDDCQVIQLHGEYAIKCYRQTANPE